MIRTMESLSVVGVATVSSQAGTKQVVALTSGRGEETDMDLHDKAKSTRICPIGVLALALALSACGGGSTPAAERRETTATSVPGGSTAASTAPGAAAGTAAGSKGSAGLCRLISQAEAEQALGKAVEAGVPTSRQTPDGLMGGCKYLGATVNPSTSSKGIVQVIVLGTKLTRAQYDELSAGDGKIGSEAEAQPVPGVGETATYVPGILFTFDAGIVMFVQAVKDDQTTVPLATMTELAQKALDRAGDLR